MTTNRLPDASDPGFINLGQGLMAHPWVYVVLGLAMGLIWAALTVLTKPTRRRSGQRRKSSEG